MVYDQSCTTPAGFDDTWFVASIFGNSVLIYVVVDNAYDAIRVDGAEFSLQGIVVDEEPSGQFWSQIFLDRAKVGKIIQSD